ncbi:MAG: hypothetical protein HY360_17800 [Verrucomicrobia bacterium]|nr:hypothetical protein [Verrucomicrobiota bacterium]
MSHHFPFLWITHWPAWLRQTLPLFAVVCAATMVRPEELLPTGGLETPATPLSKESSGNGQLPDGWVLWGTARVSALTDAAQAHGGKQAARLEPFGETQGAVRARLHPVQRIPVRPGTEYVLTAWVRGKGTATPFVWVYAANGVFLGGPKLNEGQGLNVALTEEWREISLPFTIEDDDVAKIIPGVEISGGGSWMAADDFSLRMKGEPPPDQIAVLPATATIATKAEQFSVYHNGKLASPDDRGKLSFALINGENVIGIILKGAKTISGAINVERGASIPLDHHWKISEQGTPDEWAKPGFNDTAWAPAVVKEGQIMLPSGPAVHLRRSLYWLNNLEGGWLLGNPSEIFIPRGGCVFLRAALRSPTATPLKDFRLVFTVPAFLRLLNYDQPGGGGESKDLPPLTVKETSASIDGQAYRRYELAYPAEKIASCDAGIGDGWQLQAPRPGTASIAAIFFQMESDPQLASYPFIVQRVVNGNAGDLPLPITLQIRPAFSGASPKTIQVYYYAPLVFPHEIQQAQERPWHAAYPKAVADAVWSQYSRLGANRCEIGGWGLEDRPAFQSFAKQLRQSGVKVGFGRLSGMNYLLGYLAEPLDQQSGSLVGEGNAILKMLAGQPEAQARLYSGAAESVPPVWKESVFFRWFDTKLLFDPATRARKPVFWCQQYLAEGGALFLDYWRKRFRKLLAKLSVDFVHWDWEYANVAWSCFCERDLAAFRSFARLPADAALSDAVIAQKYPEMWMKFRAWQNAEWMGHFHRMLNALGLQLEAYPPGDANLVEGLDWTQAVGKFDMAFAGMPGASPHRWFQSQVEQADRYNAMFKTRMIGQILGLDGPNSPVDTQYPRRRMNEMLRTVAIMRGGVNPWVNLERLSNVNGVECFERAAIDVIVKYEPYFLDGARATSEFDVKGLRSAAMDLAAFRLAQDQPVLLLAFNDSKRDKLAEITWKAAAAATVYYDGLSGKRLGNGKTVRLPLGPCSCAVVECRGK